MTSATLAGDNPGRSRSSRRAISTSGRSMSAPTQRFGRRSSLTSNVSRRLVAGMLFMSVLAGIAVGGAAAAAEPRPTPAPCPGTAGVPAVDGPYGVVREEATVRLRDGESTRVWVHKPAIAPPTQGWPMILQLHGGAVGTSETRSDTAPMERQDVYACRGYAVVSYFRRGYPPIIPLNPNNPSVNLGAPNVATTKGWDYGGPTDVGDGKDVISWALANQPIDPERIGATGGSQGNWVVHALAGNDPRIRAIIPTGGYDNWATHSVRNNVTTPGCAVAPALLVGALTVAESEWSKQYCLLQARGFAGMGSDNAYFWERAPARWVPKLNEFGTAVFEAIHTLDPNWNSSGHFRLYSALTGPKRIFVGPVPIHIGVPAWQQVYFHSEVQRWWDYWLKDADTGIMSQPPITWGAPPPGDFFSGTTPWTMGQAYTPTPCKAEKTSFSLSAGNRLLTGPGSGPADLLVTNPVVGNANYGLAEPQGTPLDTIAYRSAPFTQDTIIFRDVKLHLALTSLSVRYQVHPDFYEVAPNGAARRIYHYNALNVGPIEPYGVFDGAPGQAKTLDWVPYTTFYKIRAGYSLELKISTAQRAAWIQEPSPGGYQINHDGNRQSTLSFLSLPGADLDRAVQRCDGDAGDRDDDRDDAGDEDVG